jgi:hypothetical protein
MSASPMQLRRLDSTLRKHLAFASLLSCLGACTSHPMLRRATDAADRDGAEQPDAAIEEDARADAGADAGADVLDVVAPDLASPITPIRVQKLTGNTRFAFGGKVAISGDTVAIASEASNLVYFFDRTADGWIPSTVLDLPSVGTWSSAVNSLAMDGELAAVGTMGVVQREPGWVHVLRRTAGVWTVEARIDDPARDFLALFGCSVGVSAGSIVVGAARDYDSNPGAAYVFVKGASGWEPLSALSSTSDGTPATELGNDKFGRSVAISADAIAVVRPMGKHPGAVLFRRDRGVWQRDSRFQPDTSLFSQPIAVALEGSSLIIGDNALQRGFVYRSGDAGWSLEDVLIASPASNLGYSVALAGRLAVMGGLGPGGGGGPGNAYAFVRSGARWSAPFALLPEGELPPDGFGSPVAASGSTIVVGAPGAKEGDVEMGAAYVFEVDLGGAP